MGYMLNIFALWGLRFMLRVRHPQMIDFENVIGLRFKCRIPTPKP